MFSTASLYLLVAIYGESIESSEAHGIQLVEGQEDETTESDHNEEQEAVEIHNESGESQEQRLHEQEALEENTNESEHNEEGGVETEETLHSEISENQRRIFELPLSIASGIGYATVGVWMILDKRNSKAPFLIAIVGSLILLGIYIASRTVGISILGIEQVGLLDASVAGLQITIIAISLYIIISKIYAKGMTIDK